MNKKAVQEIEITRDGKKIGICRVAIRAEPDVNSVDIVDECGAAVVRGIGAKRKHI